MRGYELQEEMMMDWILMSLNVDVFWRSDDFRSDESVADLHHDDLLHDR
jgi:hypothetical protein